MTDIQKLLEQADDALTAQFATDRQVRCYLLMPDLIEALREAQAKISSLHRSVSDTAAAFAEREDTLRTRLEAAEAVEESARELLQWQLNDHAHGKVEDWSDELEEEIGWGEGCAAYRLGRALQTWRSLRESEVGGG